MKPDQLVSEAVDVMVRHDVGSLVVRQDGTMVGLLTERDVLRGLSERGCALIAVKVSEMMVTEPIIGNPDGHRRLCAWCDDRKPYQPSAGDGR